MSVLSKTVPLFQSPRLEKHFTPGQFHHNVMFTPRSRNASRTAQTSLHANCPPASRNGHPERLNRRPPMKKATPERSTAGYASLTSMRSARINGIYFPITMKYYSIQPCLPPRARRCLQKTSIPYLPRYRVAPGDEVPAREPCAVLACRYLTPPPGPSIVAHISQAG